MDDPVWLTVKIEVGENVRYGVRERDGVCEGLTEAETENEELWVPCPEGVLGLLVGELVKDQTGVKESKGVCERVYKELCVLSWVEEEHPVTD